MDTEALIQGLAADVTPVRRHAVAWRIALGIAGGALVSLVAILWVLGIRADLWLAMQGPGFWMKWGYTLSIAAGAIYATTRLARPDPGSLRVLWLLAVPVALLAMMGVAELAHAPPGRWLAMWLGHSWRRCPWLVLSLSAPIFAGLLWAFRRFAPTHLRAAGAAAGLSAGAFAATVYCIHCSEESAIFVLTWYSLGIVLAAAIGALVGPRLMRW